jgi:VWFA-related protein
MRRGWVIVILLFLATGFAEAQSPSSAPPPSSSATRTQQPESSRTTIRRRVEVVNMIFSVLDKKNRFVTDMERHEFKVFEDKRTQTIQYFSRETDLPLRIGMLIDTSNSIRERFPFEQEAAIDFFYSVLRRGHDKAFLMAFDIEPSIVQDLTDDAETLAKAVRSLRAGGGTTLWDAIYLAARNKFSQPATEDQNYRRILVVISDGQDTFSRVTRQDALEMAERSEVAIYTISTNTEMLSVSTPKPQKIQLAEGDKILKELADSTGGRSFFPYRAEDLSQSFEDIGLELRSQYSLGFRPAQLVADGRFHSVEILPDRKDVKVRSRRGYYSPKD